MKEGIETQKADMADSLRLLAYLQQHKHNYKKHPKQYFAFNKEELLDYLTQLKIMSDKIKNQRIEILLSFRDQNIALYAEKNTSLPAWYYMFLLKKTSKKTIRLFQMSQH